MPRHRIAARTRVFIDDHGLRPQDETDRSGHVLAIARRAVIHKRSAQIIQNVIRVRTAVVEPFIDDGTFLARLRKKVAIEVSVSTRSCVRKVDISQLAVAELIHFPAIGLNPSQLSLTPKAVTQALKYWQI
jgi:hypothetical protein